MDQNPSDQYQYTTFNNYSQGYPPAPPGPPTPAKTNGKSITSLVLGVLSIVVPYIGFLLGIVAIVFASLSFKELKRTGEQGKGLSIAGLVCGIVGTAIYGIILFILVLAIIMFASAGVNNYSTF